MISIDLTKTKLLSRYKKEMLERRNAHNKLEDLKGTIRVYCRIRPLFETEISSLKLQNEPYISYPDSDSIKIWNSQSKRDLKFDLDKIFYGLDNQNILFDEISPLITSVMDGYNCCIMAYGQTGTGKTYTMVWFYYCISSFINILYI